jgi:hypothetical protein
MRNTPSKERSYPTRDIALISEGGFGDTDWARSGAHGPALREMYLQGTGYLYPTLNEPCRLAIEIFHDRGHAMLEVVRIGFGYVGWWRGCISRTSSGPVTLTFLHRGEFSNC